MQRILLIRFSSLGDMVLLSALLEDLYRERPRAEIWLATKASYGSLYRHDPRVHRLLELGGGPAGMTELLSELEGVRFDLVLDAHASLRSRYLCWKLRTSSRPRRIEKDSLARILFIRTRTRTEALSRHMVARYLALIDGTKRCTFPIIHPSARDRRSAMEGLVGPVLAVAPGARHEAKRWSEERFAEVAARHQDETGCTVLVLGGPGEEASCATVAAALDPDRTQVGVGDQDLSAVAARLERCALLLCNDSGLMHLAEAVDTPVTALFGPTSRELGYFPRHPSSRVIEQDVACRPCSRFGARPCRLEENICLTHSSVDRVYDVLRSQWEGVLSVVDERTESERPLRLPVEPRDSAPPRPSLPVVGQQLASH